MSSAKGRDLTLLKRRSSRITFASFATLVPQNTFISCTTSSASDFPRWSCFSMLKPILRFNSRFISNPNFRAFEGCLSWSSSSLSRAATIRVALTRELKCSGFKHSHSVKVWFPAKFRKEIHSRATRRIISAVYLALFNSFPMFFSYHWFPSIMINMSDRATVPISSFCIIENTSLTSPVLAVSFISCDNVADGVRISAVDSILRIAMQCAWCLYRAFFTIHAKQWGHAP